jgi:hypothetical protein
MKSISKAPDVKSGTSATYFMLCFLHWGQTKPNANTPSLVILADMSGSLVENIRLPFHFQNQQMILLLLCCRIIPRS